MIIKKLRIAKIAIENFKSFRETREIDLDADVVLLSGVNGTGKTSLLEAIEVALTMKYETRLGGNLDGKEYPCALVNKFSENPNNAKALITVTFHNVEQTNNSTEKEIRKISVDRQDGIKFIDGLKSDDEILRIMTRKACFFYQDAINKMLSMDDEITKDILDRIVPLPPEFEYLFNESNFLKDKYSKSLYEGWEDPYDLQNRKQDNLRIFEDLYNRYSSKNKISMFKRDGKLLSGYEKILKKYCKFAEGSKDEDTPIRVIEVIKGNLSKEIKEFKKQAFEEKPKREEKDKLKEDLSEKNVKERMKGKLQILGDKILTPLSIREEMIDIGPFDDIQNSINELVNEISNIEEQISLITHDVSIQDQGFSGVYKLSIGSLHLLYSMREALKGEKPDDVLNKLADKGIINHEALKGNGLEKAREDIEILLEELKDKNNNLRRKREELNEKLEVLKKKEKRSIELKEQQQTSELIQELFRKVFPRGGDLPTKTDPDTEKEIVDKQKILDMLEKEGDVVSETSEIIVPKHEQLEMLEKMLNISNELKSILAKEKTIESHEKLKSVKDKIEGVAEFIRPNTLVEVKSEILDSKVMDTFKKRMSYFFQKFSVNDTIRQEVTIDRKTKRGKSGIEIKFRDIGVLNLLSSGQLNTLSMALTLAINYGYDAIPYNVICIDDVSSTVDLNNLAACAALIRSVAYNSDPKYRRQVIISTHHDEMTTRMVPLLLPPRYYGDRGKDKCEYNLKLVEFKGWSKEKGPQVESYRLRSKDIDKPPDLKEDILIEVGKSSN
ncbi:MAG: AAA family ATPase [bacterium]